MRDYRMVSPPHLVAHTTLNARHHVDPISCWAEMLPYVPCADETLQTCARRLRTWRSLASELPTAVTLCVTLHNSSNLLYKKMETGGRRVYDKMKASIITPAPVKQTRPLAAGLPPPPALLAAASLRHLLRPI